MLKPVYSYKRWSKGVQREGGSRKRQTNSAEQWVATHEGYYLDTTLSLVDDGKSGFHGRHLKEGGALRAFLDLIQAKNSPIPRGSVLYVENLDRLGRGNPVKVALPVFQAILASGVCIATETKFFDLETMEVWDLMEALIEMKRAYEESDRKSGMGLTNQAQKREALYTQPRAKKITATCPSWLRLSKDKTEFIPIPEKVATLKEVFRLAREGWGAQAIHSHFNKTGVKTISYKEASTGWTKSYILKLLSNRAVLGEYQPRSLGKPVGEPIKGYYPQVISQTEFDSAQQAKAKRRIATGPQSNRIANLFTGLVRYADDNATACVVRDGEGRYSLVSSLGQAGKGAYASFPYAFFERSLLEHIQELRVADITGQKSQTERVETELQATKAQISQKRSLIATIQARLDEAGESIQTLLDTLTAQDKALRALEAKQEEQTHELQRLTDASLTETQELLSLLDGADEEEGYALRLRLKQKLRNLIDTIYVKVSKGEGRGQGKRYLMADVHYSAGGVRHILLVATRGKPESHSSTEVWKEAPSDLKNWQRTVEVWGTYQFAPRYEGLGV